MATLTLAEKADIRFYLGWSDRFRQTDSRLEQAMLGITAEGETLVRAEIVACKDIDTRLLDSLGRLKALKVGSIDLPGKNEIDELEKQGRRRVSRIASTLSVEVREDVFSSSSSSRFGSHGGPSGGGNYALHG